MPTIASGWQSPLLTLLLLAACTQPALAAPDEDILGKAQGYPVAPSYAKSRQEPYRVGSFSALETLVPTCTLAPSATPLPLPQTTPINFRYHFRGQSATLDDYMQHQRATGVLILHDGNIVAERYNYDRSADMRMLSNSMAKTITGLGLLKAREAGLIHSFEDTAATYVPELKGTLYGETKIINLMRMASGASYVEDYSNDDDRARYNRITHLQGNIAAARSITERAEPEGTRFNYAGAQTQVLGLVLRAATHKSMCDYIETTIWQPIGAQGKATWSINPVDQTEVAQGDFNATVRDYARLGLMLANDGVVAGAPIIRTDSLLDMTDPARQPAAFRPGQMLWHGSNYLGYGLQVWLLPGSHRRFVLLGIYGQAIYVDPELKLVMVHTAVGKDAAGDASGSHLGAERDALFRGVVAQYGRW
ncbi:CubicO group peptidase (beta-lactamase class C family) [Herbaspirillum sp. Sphag1AN]|uniref:serine hydrolase domain-containing protein n=1 Tax=unclassified Herbaspirillum TaxID=2624150 RepID=UPI001614A3E0|nr:MULTISPECIES: serine hydrolase [unclassified Herbaspirillum]MBB3211804.1 CubicO group peptidase (beta-lactamase class C family) [Herbaspirillum sp. Sphag1AN]MBB3244362.1 CubicO group peptidase (beta-lactamase class C family) [Herbaspirillum sp. Sphag64]